MENGLKKKYGLLTAITMVVGIVIGSGVFFKAEIINDATGGNLPIGILAWIIGGLVMLACIYMFSILARKYEKINGIVDYAETIVGEKYAYYLGWFLSIIYYPTLTSVLSWLSARYTLQLFGLNDPTTGTCMTLACVYLCLSFALNTLSPVITGKFQVSTTAIKLIPLSIVAVVGTIAGLSTGMTVENFTSVVYEIPINTSLLRATVATAFAYEGWIIATSINAELKDSKRNLPIALISGGIIIVAVYIFYYIGLAGTVTTAELMDKGVKFALSSVFGNVTGTILSAFIAVSCLGTLNGLMIGCSRGFYSLAARNEGPRPDIFRQVDPVTNMPINAAVLGLIASIAWLFYFYESTLSPTKLLGVFSFDSSELPIVTIYAMYLPIFIKYLFSRQEKSFIKGIVAPLIAIIASFFMIFAAVYSHGIVPYFTAKAEGTFSCPVLFYLILFTLFMLFGTFFAKKEKK